jgi:hypothetical protein
MSFENIKYIDIPTLENLKIGQNIICGTNQEGFVEIWNFKKAALTKTLFD